MDHCKDLADLVAQLKAEVQSLQQALNDPNTPPSELAVLSAQLFQARHSLVAAEAALRNCQKQPPPPPPFPCKTYLKASNTQAYNRFGYSVAISADTIVIGSPSESSNAKGVNGNQADTSAPGAGAAYVFVRYGEVWSQQAYLKPSNTAAGQAFGFSVAVSGDTVVVGAAGESSIATGVNGNQADTSAPNAGAAYVFVRAGTVWSQQAYLKASNTAGGQYFDISVAVSGDTAVTGAIGESSSAKGVNGNQHDASAPNAGAAYVFARAGANWSQQAYLKASNTTMGQRFGISVAVSGDTAVTGAIGESSSAKGVNGNQHDASAPNAGAAYVFTRTRVGPVLFWVQEAYLKPSDTVQNQLFGISVAVSGDTVVVGAFGESHQTGAAFVFVRNGPVIEAVSKSRLSQVLGGNLSLFFWVQEAYLKASYTQLGQWFGSSVAVSGDMLIVGSQFESSAATGVNGNQADASAFHAGAAYAFVRADTVWSQKAYLKASNTTPNLLFGSSVSVSGGVVVVGAFAEPSNATGVNGNQADTSAPEAGAAYIFSS